jgi:hypothetical protein
VFGAWQIPDLDIFTGSEACTAPLRKAKASRFIIDFIIKTLTYSIKAG